MTDRDENYLFLEVATKEAIALLREYGHASPLKFYERDDLVNWAFIAGTWKDYVDRPGAMRQVIRYAMLRALEKYHREMDEETARTVYHRDQKKDEVTPVNYAIQAEMARIAFDSDQLTVDERVSLMKKMSGCTYGEVARSMRIPRSTAHKWYKDGLRKLRKCI